MVLCVQFVRVACGDRGQTRSYIFTKRGTSVRLCERLSRFNEFHWDEVLKISFIEFEGNNRTSQCNHVAFVCEQEQCQIRMRSNQINFFSLSNYKNTVTEAVSRSAARGAFNNWRDDKHKHIFAYSIASSFLSAFAKDSEQHITKTRARADVNANSTSEPSSRSHRRRKKKQIF